MLAEHAVPKAKGAVSYPGFTAREQEVAALLVRGDTNSEIAAALFISDASVKKHVNAMLSKTGLRNRTQLTKTILEYGG
ncbi:response regulator transcription factor [Paenibacillus sp. SI8]|uniref:response regulator transcription factor n=1 Tax=unclassified Paenibacillus TaxID=185978 RepID=UPI0034654EEA